MTGTLIYFVNSVDCNTCNNENNINISEIQELDCIYN